MNPHAKGVPNGPVKLKNLFPSPLSAREALIKS